jgi:hypothetical protein
MSASKDTNPKDAMGTGKAPISTVSAPVMAEVGLAMLEGALKYGRHNYRVSGVRASVYYDAVKNRHLSAWWEGEDIDPDSDLSHITKAIAGLVVLRDSMIQGNWIDDRPPPSPKGWLEKLNAKAAALVAKYAGKSKEPFLATDTPADVDRKLGRSSSLCAECTARKAEAAARGEAAHSVCPSCVIERAKKHDAARMAAAEARPPCDDWCDGCRKERHGDKAPHKPRSEGRVLSADRYVPANPETGDRARIVAELPAEELDPPISPDVP